VYNLFDLILKNDNYFSGYGKFGNIRENLVLSKQHFAPFNLYKEGALDDFIRGLSFQSSQNFDRFFTREVILRNV